MTKLFTFAIALFAILTTSDLFATVYTVSNVANRPAQFTQVQAAVDSAAIGDTILITGGGATYNSVSTVKPLVYIGEGIGSSAAQIGTMTLNRLNSSLSSSGSKFYGIRFISSVNVNASFSGAQAGQAVLEDILFERCYIQSFSGGASGIYRDYTFRNCVFTGGNFAFFYGTGWSATNENFLYLNCVFSDGQFSGAGNPDFNGTMIIRNSIFMNRASNVFSGIVGVVLENNIFYRAEPGGCISCTYNNNLTYLCNDNTLPPSSGNNVGSGNIVNVDPMFASYPQLGAAFSFAHNYSLLTGSPAIGSGTNSTNIGLTGGSAPVNNIPQFPKIPAVTQIDIPVSSVPVGGTLQINLRAVTRD